MNGLMLHAGGEPATFSQLGAVALPARTQSYMPVAHADLVTRAKDLFQNALNLAIKSEAYGLARDGQQFFGVLTFEGKGGEWGPSVGLRNSYDKSMPVGVAMGAHVFVCDNLAFSSDNVTVMRKHTVNVEVDLERLMVEAAGRATGGFKQISGELDAFKACPISREQGYANLGILVGRKALPATAFNAACRYWDDAPHAEHRSEDLYSWYQAVNHGLKVVTPRAALEGYGALHQRARELAMPTLVPQVIDIQ
jgi:hypothetical protein